MNGDKLNIRMVDEYPQYLPQKPTALFHRGDKKLLISDTDTWTEFQGVPMEAT